MMDEKTKKALEELQEAINSGEFDEYFKNEKRILNYLDSKVKRMMDGVIITPELEKRWVNWFAKYRTTHRKNPVLWDSVLSIIIEEGSIKIEGNHEETNLFLISSISWRDYILRQYWSEEISLIITYKDGEEILRM